MLMVILIKLMNYCLDVRVHDIKGTRTVNRIVLAAALSALSYPVYAYPTIEDKSSTAALGVEVAFLMPKSGDVQIGNAGIGLYPFKYTLSDIGTSNSVTTNHNGILSLVRLETLAYWHWVEGSFHLSGLAHSDNNLATITQSSSGAFTTGTNAHTVVPRQSVNATIDFNKVVPNAGTGWGRTTKNSGRTFTNDIGIMFQGSPNTSVTPNFTGVAAADINQTNSDLNNSLNNFKVYPFLSIGVGYTF
jgi:hypothetical protein